MTFLDLTEVQETGGAIEAGEHTVTCVEAVVKETKAGSGRYISAKFRTTSGQFIWHMFNIENPNKQAVDIGLGQLKAFLRCAGHAPTLTDVNELCGLTCLVNVKIKSDDYGDKPAITTFKPAKLEAKSTTNPFAS